MTGISSQSNDSHQGQSTHSDFLHSRSVDKRVQQVLGYEQKVGYARRHDEVFSTDSVEFEVAVVADEIEVQNSRHEANYIGRENEETRPNRF